MVETVGVVSESDILGFFLQERRGAEREEDGSTTGV